MFDAIEQGQEPDFWRGTVGRGVYDDLLSAVRQSGVPDAVEEFEARFLPLLTAKQAPDEAEADDPEELTNPDTALQDRRTRLWPGVLAVCLAAGLSALIIGINVVRTSAEPPKEANRTALTEPEDQPKILSEPPQAVTDSMTTESDSELTTEPEPAASSEQKEWNDD